MDRDTKIGLVLALAFVGLVGAVLYHKMQNPEQLYAVTPSVVVPTAPQQTPTPLPAEQVSQSSYVGTKNTTDEPPPPAPPSNPVPPVQEPVKPTPPTVAQQPAKSSSFWGFLGKSNKATVAKNDTPSTASESPPPMLPPSQTKRQEVPEYSPPPPLPPSQPVAKKETHHWYQFWSRKEPAKPSGLTYDQPKAPTSPDKAPERQDQQPPMPTMPPIREVAADSTPPQSNTGFQPPNAPADTKPLAPSPPIKKSEAQTASPLFPPQAPTSEGQRPPTEPSIIPPQNDRPVVKNDPPKVEQPIKRTENVTQPPFKPEPKPQVPATPAAEKKFPPAGKPLEEIKPLPPSNTYDRRFAPVKLGVPKEENSSAAQIPQSSSTGGGQPVRIRMQPDLPPSREGIPVVTRPAPSNTGNEKPRSPVQVESTEIRVYTPQQGETYSTISGRYYGSDKYAAALAQFNVDKERNPRMSSVWPGQRIFIPDKEYLERRYTAQIGHVTQAPARSPLDAAGPTSRYMPPAETQQVEAKVVAPRPVENKVPTPPARSTTAKDSRYRVREKDSLYSIAQKTLGKGDRWTEIYALNKDVLPDPNKPDIGLLLKLPADAKVDTTATPE